jgi:formyl-CoA transferase
MFADPQVQHLGIAQPVAGTDYKLMGQPVALSRTPSKLVAPPPARGAHTHEILAEFGLTPEEVAALEAADAI